jgi:prepilin-type N-terminal cleavage/methylation domain-containing protein
MKELYSSYRHFPLRESRRGFTMTEIAIVLGIIGLVLASIWLVAGRVTEDNNINQAVQELQTVSQNIITLEQNRPFLVAAGTDVTTAMINASAIPTAMISGGAAGNPWNPVGFKVWAVGSLTFRISFYNVPLDACIALATQGTACDPTQPGCPTKVWTGGSAGTFTGAGSPNKTYAAGPPALWQLTPVVADTALCSSNTNSPPAAPNSIEFDFSL